MSSKYMLTSNFKRLIGTWNTEGVITTEEGVSDLRGTDSYEFILDENYILHRANVTMGDERNETFEILTLNDSGEKATLQYWNSKKESGIMEAFLAGNSFVIEGDQLRFEGSINDMNTEIAGKWYVQRANNEWHSFIDLKLEKLQ